jgi:archaellum biogenesis protein FlaJ (TadC family)
VLSNHFNKIVQWFGHHAWVLWIGFALSLVTVLASIVFVPWAIVRIPPDYFTHRRPPEIPWNKLHPAVRPLAMVIKNLVGAALVFAGFIMLFIPGPGVITILVGLALMNVPGKRTLERWIVSRRTVFSALNKLRAKYSHPPLEHPQRQ